MDRVAPAALEDEVVETGRERLARAEIDRAARVERGEEVVAEAQA